MEKEDRVKNVLKMLDEDKFEPEKTNDSPLHQLSRDGAVTSGEKSSKDEDSKIYNVASVTKMFTAATVMRMTEEEQYKGQFELGIDTPLSNFIDDMKERYQGKKTDNLSLTEDKEFHSSSIGEFFNKIKEQSEIDNITIRDLIQHTSGLPQPTGAVLNDIYGRPEKNGDEAREPKLEWELEDFFQGKFLDIGNISGVIETKKGNPQYNNLGYWLLTGVIETSATKSNGKETGFRDVMNDLVIDKIGLQNTFTADKTHDKQGRELEKRTARGKSILGHDEKVEDITQGAGELRSTPDDINKFTQAFFTQDKEKSLFKSDNIREDIRQSALDAQSRLTQKIKENGLEDGKDDEYCALGFEVIGIKHDGDKIKFMWGKYGDSESINALAAYDPETGISASFVATYDEPLKAELEKTKSKIKESQEQENTESPTKEPNNIAQKLDIRRG